MSWSSLLQSCCVWTQTVHTCWTSDWQSTDSLTTDSFFQVLLITPFFLSLTRSWVYCTLRVAVVFNHIQKTGVKLWKYQKDKHQNLWRWSLMKCVKRKRKLWDSDRSVSISKFGYKPCKTVIALLSKSTKQHKEIPKILKYALF